MIKKEAWVLAALGLVAAVAGAIFVACSDGSEGSQPSLSGGVLATFAVDDEEFKVWVTNEATIQQLRDLKSGKSVAGFPNGRVARGAGEGDHNAPWSWHLDPEDIEIAEVTMELCDAEPSYVEDNLGEFVSGAGRYCPWTAQLVDLEEL